MLKKMFLIGLLFSIAVVLLPNQASAYHHKHRPHGRTVVISPRVVIHPVHYWHHSHHRVVVAPSRGICQPVRHSHRYHDRVACERRRW